MCQLQRGNLRPRLPGKSLSFPMTVYGCPWSMSKVFKVLVCAEAANENVPRRLTAKTP